MLTVHIVVYIETRVTRNNNSNVTQFITRKCKTTTTTFKDPFLIEQLTRLWNILGNDLQLTLSLPLSTFKSRLMEYYKNALVQSYMTPRTFDHG